MFVKPRIAVRAGYLRRMIGVFPPIVRRNRVRIMSIARAWLIHWQGTVPRVSGRT